ncbi:MAG: urate hydroxylase PuuD [Elusimicrobia bacterium]|nr:urate hydroxylase PuuD [Elusimicrobiota bacterium]
MDVIHLFARWLHVWFGIIWIGFLYFFNFVNIPLQGALDDAGKKAVNPQLMPRALFWFRWGAMMTFVFGWVLYVINYMYIPSEGFGPNALFHSARHAWILMGMLLGTIMWFNVWFIIWPAQKLLLGGKAGDQAAAIRAKAGKASRINTYLSGPMLFGMLGAPHFGQGNHAVMAGLMVAGAVVIFAAYKHSTMPFVTKID